MVWMPLLMLPSALWYRRSPTFAVTAVLILGVGIGMAVAMSGVFNAVLVRPLPVVSPAGTRWGQKAVTPFGVPRPVGPSQPLPAWHHRLGEQEPLEPLVTSFSALAWPQV